MSLHETYDEMIEILNSSKTTSEKKGYFLDRMRKEAERLLASKSVVLCGATPFAKHVFEHREWLFHDDVDLVIEDFDEDTNTIAEAVYVLCSRPNISRHIDYLHKKGIENILPYQFLLLLEPRFGANPYAYTYDKMEKQIEDIIEHAGEYQHIYESLCDSKSKELLMKMIVYRLTYDYHMHENNATQYPHYFDEDVFTLQDDEIIVDCGGYIGDTLEVVKNLTANSYKQYYLFEPDESLISIAKKKGDERVVFINKGVWENEEVLFFKQQTANGNGAFVDEKADGGILEVPVTSLDLTVSEATFIKMDVEGSELMALKGAQKLIQKCHPKMAICVYHKYEDYRELFSFIEPLGYKMFLRAEMNNIDTELYYLCIPETRED